MNTPKTSDHLQPPSELREHIVHQLYVNNYRRSIFSEAGIDWPSASAVLFLLGCCPEEDPSSAEPCLILTKRSAKVRQPGDLCCPGGKVKRRLDAAMGSFFKLPLLPLARWPYWPEFLKKRPREAKWLRLLLATGVRESVEELRLNPFALKFLGPLPAQPLTMFQQIIHPMVIWISGQKRFHPNWEVDRIIYLPLRDLLNPERYARYQLRFETHSPAAPVQNFPCFRIENQYETELLWGATYRITTFFLNDVFGFVPPDMNSLPKIAGRLDREYLSNHPQRSDSSRVK